MKKIVIIHTVQSVLQSFPALLRETSPSELQIDNMLDEFLAAEPKRTGEMSTVNKNRLFYFLKAAEMAEPDLIIVSCSTLTPIVEEIRPFMQIPVLAVDDAMCREVAAKHRAILVMATAQSTLQPTVSKIAADAAGLDRRPEIGTLFVPDAIDYLNRGEREVHDRLLLDAAANVRDKGFDAIVLAQASMAHMEEAVAAETGIPTYSSPSRCVRAALDSLFA